MKTGEGIESLLIGPREAAKLLNISLRHLHTLTGKGVIPCVRLGRSVRYSVDQLRRWIAERCDSGKGGAVSIEGA